ncbi:MAG: hypothetical protein COX57_04455 [Alphaproteobacteria bacterium CG_4_10_14_0_2_um_filter_63_37]|nr:MAG: hypothetical protein AUJ55_02910 [Proteobacteria bacterium CG1_02_64_396]PJA25215.1 MAG: hypothetical protein COX57_04455 [Alphaproteobacteria bacterium CG_4_10_14_0_2_um_filter_63_37]
MRNPIHGGLLALMLIAGLSLAGVAQAQPSTTVEDKLATSYQLEVQGKYPEALAALSDIIPNGTGVAEFLALRSGWLLYLAERYGDALEAYQRAATLNPRSVEAHLGASLPLMAQYRWREAAQECRNALKIAPGNQTAAVRLVVLTTYLADWSQIAETARQVHAMYPTDLDALYWLARGLSESGQLNEARPYWRQLQALVPGHAEAKAWLEVPVS